MEVYVGKTGLSKTFQADFKAEVKCPHCKGGIARIGFVAREDGGKLMCDLHPNDFDDEKGWLHDVCAVAFYICGKCFAGIVEWNQS